MPKELFIKDYTLDLLRAVIFRKDNDLINELIEVCESNEHEVGEVIAALIRDSEISSFYYMLENGDSGCLFMPKGSRVI